VRHDPCQRGNELRKLTAENSTSVVQNLASIYGALASRFLARCEAGADQALVSLTKEMHRNLDLRARISKELAPNPSMAINNVFALPRSTTFR
jgi:hypothetical protein